MGIQNPKNIGGHLVVADALISAIVTADVPPNTANKTPVFDRQANGMPQSATLRLQAGASGGTLGTMNLTAKIQDSDDGTTFADYIPPPIAGLKQTAAPSVSLTAVNTSGHVDVDLSGARRYVSVDVNPNFTGGSSPTIQAAATLSFGGMNVEPQSYT